MSWAHNKRIWSQKNYWWRHELTTNASDHKKMVTTKPCWSYLISCHHLTMVATETCLSYLISCHHLTMVATKLCWSYLISCHHLTITLGYAIRLRSKASLRRSAAQEVCIERAWVATCHRLRGLGRWRGNRWGEDYTGGLDLDLSFDLIFHPECFPVLNHSEYELVAGGRGNI